jgi:18 kDa antigen 2
MATATFDPFREFERLFTGVSTPQSSNLSMDLYKKGDVFVAEIDMPGVDPASVDIDIDDRTLTVRAERSSVSGEDIEWLTRERRNGTFARQLTLGRGLATDRIEAAYEDGVLKLTLPVAEEAKPRKITVNHVIKSDTAERKEVDGAAQQ